MTNQVILLCYMQKTNIHVLAKPLGILIIENKVFWDCVSTWVSRYAPESYSLSPYGTGFGQLSTDMC